MAARPEAGATYADATVCEAVAMAIDSEPFVCCSQTETAATMATVVVSAIDDASNVVFAEATEEVPEAWAAVSIVVVVQEAEPLATDAAVFFVATEERTLAGEELVQDLIDVVHNLALSLHHVDEAGKM